MQSQVPFCYPYGKSDSFNATTVKILQGPRVCVLVRHGKNTNLPGIDIFAINRLDGQHHPTLQRWKEKCSEQAVVKVSLSA